MKDNNVDITALADEIESYIQELVPDSVPVKKYGGTLFTLHPDKKEGQFCGVFVQAKHVQISFSKGAELKDTKKLLSGSGKLRRHINYSLLQDVNFDELKPLLKQASKL